MTQSPQPISTNVYPPANADLEHLRLLAVFHWVVGGLVAFIGCFPIFHLIMGILIVAKRFPPGAATQPDDTWFGWIFILLGGGMILFFWSIAAATILSGFKLRQHRDRTFSLVVAAICCLFFPFGTTLGVFTLIVLCRRSVEELYRSTART